MGRHVPDFLNLGIGLTGTGLATLLRPEHAAMAAGFATAAWMFWQLGCSMYDRFQSRRKK